MTWKRLEVFTLNVAIDNKVTCDDIALLMYTSGTTGKPKGVLFKHVTIIKSFINVSVVSDLATKGIFNNPLPDSTFIGYLPLAHILEFTQELLNLVMGTKIAYSSPYTLTENGLSIHPGDKADIEIARPTNFLAVSPGIESNVFGHKKEGCK